MIRKALKHAKLWNEWRKNSLNGAGHKFFVLIGVRKSPTFEFFKISQKTRQDKFLEMFPNARMTELGSIKICPADVDRNVTCLEGANCLNCRKKYWLE